MLTNTEDLEGAELGWGLRSIGRGLKKIGKGAVKGVAKVGTVAAKTGFTVAKTGVKTGYKVGAFGVKQAVKIPKAVANLALRPVRSKLNTLKSRRANLIAFTNRGVKAPTVAEKAQARKDVKSMLSKKGPHGKMLAYLAGGPTLSGGLGITGFDDAALAAIATTLAVTAAKILSDAAKSKFAPVDAAKAGVRAAAAQSLTTATQAISPAAPAAVPVVPEEPSAEPVTEEEVAEEPAVEAAEVAEDVEASNVEGALAGLGWLDGFMGVAEEANAPAAMEESTARKIGSAAQRMVCSMSVPALNAIGGVSAVRVAGSLCEAVSAGDDASVRRLLPAAVSIASQATNAFAAELLRLGREQGGGLPSAGFGAAKLGVRAKYGRLPAAMQDELPARSSARKLGVKGKYSRPLTLMGVTPDELGALSAFAGSDPEQLGFGLAGVSVDDLQASAEAASGSAWVLLPAVAAVALGLWGALR